MLFEPLARLLPVLVLLAVAGCDAPAGPFPVAVLLSLEAEVVRDTVSNGDTVTVRFTARNLGRNPVSVTSMNGCLLTGVLYDASGVPYEAPMRTRCSAGQVTWTFQPGTSRTETHLMEVGVIIGGDVFARAAPGSWLLHARVYTPDGRLPGTVETPATVTVQ